MKYLAYAGTAALIGTVAVGAALAGVHDRGAPTRQLVIDVHARGAGLPDEGDILSAVGVGASMANAVVVPLAYATAADSALYAVLEIERDGDSEFRLATRLGGAAAHGLAPIDQCRTSATARGGEVGFGAYLAAYVSELARCAQHQRRLTRP